MSESAVPRRILHLVTEGLSTARLEELRKNAQIADAHIEIFPLTQANAPAALEKIFAADTVAVWGETSPPNPKI